MFVFVHILSYPFTIFWSSKERCFVFEARCYFIDYIFGRLPDGFFSHRASELWHFCWYVIFEPVMWFLIDFFCRWITYLTMLTILVGSAAGDTYFFVSLGGFFLTTSCCTSRHCDIFTCVWGGVLTLYLTNIKRPSVFEGRLTMQMTFCTSLLPPRPFYFQFLNLFCAWNACFKRFSFKVVIYLSCQMAYKRLLI